MLTLILMVATVAAAVSFKAQFNNATLNPLVYWAPVVVGIAMALAMALFTAPIASGLIFWVISAAVGFFHEEIMALIAEKVKV